MNVILCSDIKLYVSNVRGRAVVLECVSLGSNPGSVISYHVTLWDFIYLSVPQFPYWYSRANTSTHLVVLGTLCDLLSVPSTKC